MHSSQPKDSDRTLREQGRRRRMRLPGAILSACMGLFAFLSTADNPRFEAIHTLDVIRLMAAGAGFGVALVLLAFSFLQDGEQRNGGS